jgi:hypothetical protein
MNLDLMFDRLVSLSPRYQRGALFRRKPGSRLTHRFRARRRTPHCRHAARLVRLQGSARLYTLLAFGALGWLMKRAHFPRAPLLVGFVLADPIERNFWLAYQLHGWTWLKAPIVLGLFALVALHLTLTFRRAYVAKKSAARTSAAAPPAPTPAQPSLTRIDLGLLLALGAAVLFTAGIILSFDFDADSRLVPLLAAVPGLAAALIILGSHLRGRTQAIAWPSRSEAVQIGLFAAAIAAIPFIGFLAAVAAYLGVLLWTRTSLRLLLIPYAAAIVLSAYGLTRVLNLSLP